MGIVNRVRKPHLEDNENHDRWLVSYSDFMTLLFAFFVVMYAISSVNEGKYRVLSKSLSATFSDENFTLQPIQIGEPAKTSSLHPVVTEQLSDGIDQDPGDTELQILEKSIEDNFQGLIADDTLTISSNEQWLQVSLQSNLLFAAGQTALSAEGKEMLDGVIQQFSSVNHPITVEGYTDSLPVSGGRYATNWELSAARAAGVVRYFIEQGTDKTRMAVAAYGDNHPIDTNATPAGRAKNRRVTLLISLSLIHI